MNYFHFTVFFMKIVSLIPHPNKNDPSQMQFRSTTLYLKFPRILFVVWIQQHEQKYFRNTIESRP